ncbi:MAG: methyltransferase domain-containing protein [Alphaproteobacteria bacterium]|nr:methyltransferase domain-containing protein [Alphaproteobacteria bacterium]
MRTIFPPRTEDEARDFAADLMERYRLPSGGQVVEIGSGDGALLRALQERGCRILGVESERDVAIRAWESGIDTLPRRFTAELARETILEQRGAAVMVIAGGAAGTVIAGGAAGTVIAGGAAGTVIAGGDLSASDDPADLLDGVRLLLTPGGLFVLETPAPGDSSGLLPLLRAHGFEAIEALRVGGRLRVDAKVAGGPWPVGSSVAAVFSCRQPTGEP